MIPARESGTAARRAGILAAARRVFLRESYSGTSMGSIAQEAGVSKQTVYNHFGSKEDLFQELVRSRCEQLAGALGEESDYAGEDPERVLSRVGDTVLAVMLSKESMDLYRVVQAEGRNHPQLARVFYRLGPDRTANWLTDFFAEQTLRGRLHVANARLAAEQFVAMLAGHLRLRHLLGLADPPDAVERRRYVASAVRIFLDGTRPR